MEQNNLDVSSSNEESGSQNESATPDGSQMSPENTSGEQPPAPAASNEGSNIEPSAPSQHTRIQPPDEQSPAPTEVTTTSEPPVPQAPPPEKAQPHSQAETSSPLVPPAEEEAPPPPIVDFNEDLPPPEPVSAGETGEAPGEPPVEQHNDEGPNLGAAPELPPEVVVPKLDEDEDDIEAAMERIEQKEEERKKKKPKAMVHIGERLIEKGLISQDQLEVALKIQRERDEKVMVGAILLEMGFITESTLSEVLSESVGVEQFDPSKMLIDASLVKQVPKEVATRYKAVPILQDDESIYVAMADIYDVMAIDMLQRYFPKNYRMVPVHSSEGDLSEIIEKYYEYTLSIDGILKEIEGEEVEDLVNSASNEDTYINPTVRLIDAFLADAIHQGASDMHFEPEEKFVRLRYRIDGKLRHIKAFHKDYWPAVIVRIKIISDMNIAETRMPQDGRISYNVMGRQIDFRVATQPTISGENVVLRLLDKQKALLPMEALGFSDPNVKNLKKALRRPEGIIIVTGPTGSGKTTTLYSILNFINKPDINIMTLEDPVEYQLSMIRQSNVRESVGMGFASGVKSLLRQDPDVIFVGEVRDADTANMALKAALTGHQVYTSLHTNDALGAIPRLVDLGVLPRMLSGAIICIIAQRLARRLCKFCKEEVTADADECRILDLPPEDPPKIFRHKGCDECSFTGYKGRVGVSEVLMCDTKIDEMIALESTKSEMLEHARTNGYLTMADDGVDKVLKGMMDIEELIRTVDVTSRM